MPQIGGRGVRVPGPGPVLRVSVQGSDNFSISGDFNQKNPRTKSDGISTAALLGEGGDLGKYHPKLPLF